MSRESQLRQVLDCGIVAVVPDRLTLAVWSPALDATGNSLLGMKALVGLIRAGQQAGVVRRAVDPTRAAWEWVRWLFGGLRCPLSWIVAREVFRAAAPPDDRLPAAFGSTGLVSSLREGTSLPGSVVP